MTVTPAIPGLIRKRAAMKDDGSLTLEQEREARKLNAKSQVHAWIRYDLGMAAKMTLTPEQVDKLLTRLGF